MAQKKETKRRTQVKKLAKETELTTKDLTQVKGGFEGAEKALSRANPSSGAQIPVTWTTTARDENAN